MSTNRNLTYLKENLLQLDKRAEEISFTNGRHEEILYNLKWPLDATLSNCINELIEEYFPEIDKSKIEAFSYQVADGTVYSEDKLMLLLNGAERDCFLYPEVGCYTPWMDYSLNRSVTNRITSVKFYDVEKELELPFQKPPNTVIANRFGIGVGIKPNVVGIYLLARDYEAVVRFLDQPDPIPPELKQLVLEAAPIHPFGIAFNELTGEILKLNYYLYYDYVRDGLLDYLKDI